MTRGFLPTATPWRFVSPVGGIAQVFLMLTSGGEPLQLTNDEGDKDVDNFCPTGKKSITRGLSAATRSGRCLRSAAVPAGWRLATMCSLSGWRIHLLYEVDSPGFFVRKNPD